MLAHHEKFGRNFSSFSLEILYNFLHSSLSLFFRGLDFSLLCFPTEGN